jgi:hypothetical protein
VYIRLISVVSLAARKDNLEAETPIGNRGYRYRHSMEKLSMIIGVIMRVLTTHPALEVGYVALEECHYADLPNRLPLVAAPAPRTVPPFDLFMAPPLDIPFFFIMPPMAFLPVRRLTFGFDGFGVGIVGAAFLAAALRRSPRLTVGFADLVVIILSG